MNEVAQLEYGRAWPGSAVQNARGPKLGVLALILTCRALHDEVLDIFCAHKTWHFNDLYTIIYAANHISKKHFNNIRSLHLDAKALPAMDTFTNYITGLPGSYQQRFARLAPPAKGLAPSVDHRVDTDKVYLWQAVCHAIANMEALKKLRFDVCRDAFVLHLRHKPPEKPITGESFVFGPLSEIGKRRDLDVFEVRVDWPVGDDDMWAEEAEKGFTLIRLAEGSFPGWQFPKVHRCFARQNNTSLTISPSWLSRIS